MSTTSTSLLGKDGGKLFQVYGAFVGAFLVLLAALGFVLRRREDAAAVGLRRPAERPWALAG